MAAPGAAICNALSGWVEAQRRYPSPMGLDDCCRATGQDSGECPETVTHVQIIEDMYNIQFLNAEKMTSNISTYHFTSYNCQQFYGDILK